MRHRVDAPTGPPQARISHELMAARHASVGCAGLHGQGRWPLARIALKVSRRPGTRRQGRLADIFISYARGDRERIADLSAALEQHGWSVWWDRHIDGGSAFA